jgi:hypothetical protein
VLPRRPASDDPIELRRRKARLSEARPALLKAHPALLKAAPDLLAAKGARGARASLGVQGHPPNAVVTTPASRQARAQLPPSRRHGGHPPASNPERHIETSCSKASLQSNGQ